MGWYENRVFPWILERLEGPEVVALRERCVRGAEGNVLEIGFGTGKTLPFYTDRVTSLTAVEPADGMNRVARERIAATDLPVEIVPIAGEQLPFEDNSFDSVVVTMVLCSVTEPPKVLGEMLRVLRPGGRYHFLEHVVSERPFARRVQHAYNPVNRVIGCGCNLIRDTGTAIRDAGFVMESFERIMSKHMPIHPELFPIILGTAAKPAPAAA